jgi:hypothetical protein
MSVNMTARSPESGVGMGAPETRIADAAEERLDGGKIDWNDGVRDFAVRLPVHSLGGRGVRRMNETEGGAVALIEPIGHVFDSVAVLNVDVTTVRLGDIIGLHAAQVMAIHVDRHAIPLSPPLSRRRRPM